MPSLSEHLDKSIKKLQRKLSPKKIQMPINAAEIVALHLKKSKKVRIKKPIKMPKFVRK